MSSPTPNQIMSPEQEKMLVQLLTHTLEATSNDDTASRSSSQSATRPLCLQSVAVGIGIIAQFTTAGKLPATHLDRPREIFNDYPAFANALVTWIFSHSSEDGVRSTLDKLGPCHCNKDDIWIDFLHSNDLPISSPESGIRHVGSSILTFIDSLLTVNAELLRKLDRANSLGALKDKQYEALARYIFDEPSTLVQAMCSWYRVWDCTPAMDVLGRIPLTLQIRLPENIVEGLDAEIIVDLARRTAGMVEDCHRRRALDSSLREQAQGYMGVLMWVTTAPEVNHPYIRHILGLHAKTIDAYLRTILEDGDQKIAWDSSGFLKNVLLPGFAVILGNLYQHFGESHGLAPPDPQLKKLFAPLSNRIGVKSAVWMGLLGAIGGFRNLNSCANTACQKLPSGPSDAFQRCSRCKIVPYCSTECQIAAWTGSELPHKKVCKDWARLSGVWPRNLQSFVESHYPKDGQLDSSDPERGWKALNEQLRSLAEGAGVTEATARQLYDDTVKFASLLKPGEAKLGFKQRGGVGSMEGSLEGSSGAKSTLAVNYARSYPVLYFVFLALVASIVYYCAQVGRIASPFAMPST